MLVVSNACVCFVFLIKGATCTNKCDVQIYHLNNPKTSYYVHQVFVTIGTDQTFMHTICQPSQMAYVPKVIYINCSSWMKG